MECWVMPTWCHMFNSILTGNARVWFDDLSQESIDSYDDLRKAFLENYLQQKKCIKDPVGIHNIKQRDGEITEGIQRRLQAGMPLLWKMNRVARGGMIDNLLNFMNGITFPSWINGLHDNFPKSVDWNDEVIAGTACMVDWGLLPQKSYMELILIDFASLGGKRITKKKGRKQSQKRQTKSGTEWESVVKTHQTKPKSEKSNKSQHRQSVQHEAYK
ncbi:reverse transcriptase domain-containing protein [Tanacetum coccineum]